MDQGGMGMGGWGAAQPGLLPRNMRSLVAAVCPKLITYIARLKLLHSKMGTFKRGHRYGLRSRSGSLAMFAAIRRVSMKLKKRVSAGLRPRWS